MTNQAVLCHYHYDPLDRLATRTPLAEAMARRFYKEGQLATELQDTEQRTFLRAASQLLAQKSQSTSALLATDQQNSVLQATTPQQQTPVAYAPYGHRQDVVALPGLPGFNGEQPDPITGHYLLGNGYRAYNPVLMRFNSPDSLSPFGEGGLNVYAYCVGDPVNRSDPTGHMPLPPKLMTRVPRHVRTAARDTNIIPGRVVRVSGNNAVAGVNIKPKTSIGRAPTPVFSEMPPHVQDKIIDYMSLNNASTAALINKAASERVMAVSVARFKQQRIADLPYQKWLAKLDQIYFGEVKGIAPMFLKREGIPFSYVQANLIRKPREIGKRFFFFPRTLRYGLEPEPDSRLLAAQLNAMNGGGF